MRYFQSPQMVTSLVSIQFQDVGTDVSTVTENWETWASRNHETNIQILQVLNALQVTDASSYALNALKVKWMPGLNTPTLTMAIKGLPLDFCNHNLIEGISMRLQIDTYLEMQVVNGNIGPKLIDRRICPLDIKVQRFTDMVKTFGSLGQNTAKCLLLNGLFRGLEQA